MNAADARPGARAMVLLHHGVFTWGGSARESYERMIAVVDDAERWTERRQTRPLRVLGTPTPVGVARARASALAPRLRGALATAVSCVWAMR